MPTMPSIILEAGGPTALCVREILQDHTGSAQSRYSGSPEEMINQSIVNQQGNQRIPARLFFCLSGDKRVLKYVLCYCTGYTLVTLAL